MKRLTSLLLALMLMLSVFVTIPVSAADRLYGDVNNDGKIGVTDYILLRLYVMKMRTLSDVDRIYADINSDGKVDSRDYIALRLHCLKTSLIIQPTEENRPLIVAYIPLDDRPVNVERAEYLAASAGFKLLMPEKSLFATVLDGQPKNSGGQVGDRKALLDWLKSVENDVDVFVISLDQMLSGGLVGSRWFDNTDLTFEYSVADYIISLTKSKKVYLFDTVMRLASTVGFDGYGLTEYNQLREYAGNARKTLTGNALTIDNIIGGYRFDPFGNEIYTPLSDKALTKYFASRERKLKLADYIFRNSSNDMFCFVGVDDSSPKNTVQTNEINYITNILGKRGALFAGTDELGLMCFAKLCADFYKAPTVSVSFFGGGEDEIADSFDIDSLEVCLNKHFDGLGIKRSYSDSFDLKVLVLTRAYISTTAQNAATLIDEYNKYAKEGIPVAVIDISGEASTLANKFSGMKNLEYILGYSSWNTAANAIGISLSNAISRLAFLNSGRSDTQESRAGFARSIVFSFCKDIGYKYGAKGTVDRYIQSLGGNTSNYYSIVTPDIEKSINSVFEKSMTQSGSYPSRIISALHSSKMLTSKLTTIAFLSVELKNFRLPWYRTFEAAFDINVRQN